MFRILLLSTFLYFTSLFVYSQSVKSKIFQTATIDMGRILNLIEVDDDFRNLLENYRVQLDFRAEEIRDRIFELEIYLDDNEDFSQEKKKEIINDIQYQKKLLESFSSGDEEGEDQGFLNILFQVIKKVAEREGFALVIEKQAAVIYFIDEVDLTDLVIKEVKAQLKEQ